MDSEETVKSMRGRGRGRGRGSRGRGVRGGRGGRGRGKKSVTKIDTEEGESVVPLAEGEECQIDESQVAPKIDLEADISQLEAPTFTTLNRGPPEPMLRLRWDHRVNLVAEKVLNPMIHCCDKCMKPILIYGRMIPCKHVFCLSCAKREDKVCPRCLDKVIRVEQTGLGTVFMCTHGGTRYGSAGCRRTYLSQRDLQAHFNHRHIAASVPSLGSSGGGEAPPEPPAPVKIPTMNSGTTPQTARIKPPPQTQHMTAAGDPRIQPSQGIIDHHRRNSPPPPPPQFVPHRPPMIMPNYQQQNQQAPVSNMRTNLITVQIQDSGMDVPPTTFQQHYSHAPPPQYAPPYGVPPPPPPVIPSQPPQFYPTPAGTYPPPPGPPQPPQYGATGPPQPSPIPRQPHYQEPIAQPYAPPPPQWQHPPPNSNQQFYR